MFGLHSFESMPIAKQLVQGSVVQCRHIGVGLSCFVSVVEFAVLSQALLGLSAYFFHISGSFVLLSRTNSWKPLLVNLVQMLNIKINPFALLFC